MGQVQYENPYQTGSDNNDAATRIYWLRKQITELESENLAYEGLKNRIVLLNEAVKLSKSEIDVLYNNYDANLKIDEESNNINKIKTAIGEYSGKLAEIKTNLEGKIPVEINDIIVRNKRKIVMKKSEITKIENGIL